MENFQLKSLKNPPKIFDEKNYGTHPFEINNKIRDGLTLGIVIFQRGIATLPKAYGGYAVFKGTCNSELIPNDKYKELISKIKKDKNNRNIYFYDLDTKDINNIDTASELTFKKFTNDAKYAYESESKINESGIVKFNEDEDLGKVIAKKQLFSFGAAPLTEFKEIVFAAGGNKFSSLCGFRFTSKAETDYKEFFIAFVCKLRSKIYRQASTNPSQWFIFKKISGKEMHCLSKDDLRNQYGFDIKKFFDSDYFQQSLVKFKAAIDKGLNTYVPDYVKKHGMEKAKDLLTSYDGQNDALVKDAIGRYATAIKESLDHIDDPYVNDKFYKLIDYDIKVEKEDVNEDDIVAEASRWDCEVTKEEEDGEEVWKIYEKNDHIWVATFHDEAAANAFAKTYPKMKEDYLKQAREAETKEEMVEKEEPSVEEVAEKELDDKIEEAMKEIYK